MHAKPFFGSKSESGLLFQCSGVSEVSCYMPSSRFHLARQFCTQVIFGFTIADFLNDPCVRDHHVVELWSGVASIVRAAHEKGLTAVPFDKFRCPGVTEVSEDILTKDGFLAAVRCVLSLVAGGLLWMAPDCSSFGWMNSSNCKRSAANHWRGDETYWKVQAGNLGADIACFLFWLGWAREVEVGMENPSRNDFWKYGKVTSLVEHLKLITALANRCAYDTAPLGERALKQYKFVATGSWIQRTARKCRCPNGVHKQLAITDARGVTGIPHELKASGAYPRRLGATIVSAWDGRFPGSELGSGVTVRRPKSTSQRHWAQQDSDSSDVPVQNSAGRASKRRRLSLSSDSSSSSKSGRRKFRCSGAAGSASSSSRPQSRADESSQPARRVQSRRKWLVASDSD